MDPAVFKGMKLLITTPMYRPEVVAAYKASYVELTRYLAAHNISYGEIEMHDTYLPRARNSLAMHLLDSDATHQLLLDADMGWDSPDIMRMLYWAATRPDIEVIGAAYPQRCFDWQRVKDAVKKNPDITPYQLERVAAGKWTFKGLDTGSHNLGEPIELTLKNAHVGTGLMVISRTAYDKAKKIAPVYIDPQSKKTCWKFFHADTKDDQWIGEDVWFCRKWQSIGGKTWLAGWVKSEHVGLYSFKGDVNAVLEAGMEL